MGVSFYYLLALDENGWESAIAQATWSSKLIRMGGRSLFLMNFRREDGDLEASPLALVEILEIKREHRDEEG